MKTLKNNYKKSNLNWIFKNGKRVDKYGYGRSITTLMKCMGFKGKEIRDTDLAIITMLHAEKFLQNNDKTGWLKHCEEYIKEEESYEI